MNSPGHARCTPFYDDNHDIYNNAICYTHSFRWARGRTDDSATVNANASGAAEASTNPFARLSNTLGISGYIPLRSNERTNEEEAYFALSRWERFLGFLCCCAGAAVCFFVAFLTIPMLAIKPRKFAVAFSLGSLLFMLGCVTSPLTTTSRSRLSLAAAFVSPDSPFWPDR